jgi:hypothetical protein
MQAATIAGSLLIGGSSGYLYADTKALERIHDLSAQSRLRKEYQQLYAMATSTAWSRSERDLTACVSVVVNAGSSRRRHPRRNKSHREEN